MSEMSSGGRRTGTRLIIGGVLVALVAVFAAAFFLTRGDDDGGSPERAATRAGTAAASPGADPSVPGASKSGGAAPSSRAAAPSVPSVPPGMAVVRVAQLPAEARETLRLIDAGGPFPYAKDGSVFANREGRLPKQKNGYYREYTVDTPGSDDRGARRIIAGSSGERYYTSDHYATFRVIVP